MDYLSTQEIAEKWGVSIRYVQRLLHDGRVKGAKKYGVTWLIPTNTEKPKDPRMIRQTPVESNGMYHPIAAIDLPRNNPDAVIKTLPQDIRKFVAADLSYRRGDPIPAQKVWQSIQRNDCSLPFAASLAIAAAISDGNYESYNEIQNYLDDCIAKTENQMDRSLLSLPQVLTAVSMSSPDMTPDWLKKGDYSQFPNEIAPFLLYLRTLHLRNINDKRGMLCTAEASLLLCEKTDTFTWLDLYNLVLCASACFNLGEEERAEAYLNRAMDLGLPFGMISPFADMLGSFAGLMERTLQKKYPQYRDPIFSLWNRFFKNWMVFHNRFDSANIATILTAQEYQLARFISHGASYATAAKEMHLSIGRVKNIMSSVYTKLLIRKKSQLPEFFI